MSQMKKRLDEINDSIENYLHKIEEETGERRVCLDSINEKFRQLMVDHGNLKQPLDPRWFK